MQGADHESAQLLLPELVDRDRTRATGDVAPPAPPYLLLSHGEEFEERVRLASEAVARIDSYVELLCLEAVGRAVVGLSRKAVQGKVGFVMRPAPQ